MEPKLRFSKSEKEKNLSFQKLGELLHELMTKRPTRVKLERVPDVINPTKKLFYKRQQ
jgi:hypothetical protein